MSTRDNAFIDAYGIELTDDLAAQYDPARRNETLGQQHPVSQQTGEDGRSYRFDAGSTERESSVGSLRGPHFRIRSTEPERSQEQGMTWDDSVIDVGAGWHSEIANTFESPAEDRTDPEAFAETIETVDTSPSMIIVGGETESEEVDAKQEASSVDEPEDDVQEDTASSGGQAAKTLPIVTPVVPAWEVDGFQWPAEIDLLFEDQAEYFEHAGHKLLAASREGLSTLAITSASPGEGTTTVALCLARAVAAAGGRVAVLDGNLQNPQIGKALSLEFASGWQLAASGAVDLAEAAIAGLEERITLFPAGVANEGASSLADESVPQVLRRAAAGFDLLFIDAGQGELGANAEFIDAAMVVRDVRRTSDQQSLATALLLREAGVRAVGIAENFSGAAKQLSAAA